MQRPNLTIALSNGGLNLLAPSEFGTCGVVIASPVAPVAGYGVAFLIKSKDQAATAFAQDGNEDVLSAIQDYFYAEAPEGTSLYVLCMAQATTLTTMAGAANTEKVLNLGEGAIRLMAYIKFPDLEEYEPTITTGFDADVHTAVTAAQTLAATWLGKKKPFRYFIEGFGFVDTAAAKDYSTTANRNGFIVAANIDSSTAFATMIALGRAAGIPSQRNIGRGKDASLNIDESAVVKVGAIVADAMTDTDLTTLWNKRYITIIRNPIASGYIFDDDPALTVTTDDYNNLRYGRVIDNIVRIAFVTYAKEMKDDVDVDEGGRLSVVIEKALQSEVETAVDSNMGSQLSKNKDGTAAITCLVNPDPAAYAALYLANGIDDPNLNLLQSGQVYLFVSGRPKGSLNNLNIYIGFTAN